jgi:hypothetical protein
VGTLEFNLSKDRVEELYDSGHEEATKFLDKLKAG